MQLHLVSAQSAEVQQLLLNVEKLAQLKQILTDLKKGYDIASAGYGKIKDISQGNFGIHELFLDGLLTVNPNLRKYRRVADIISYQVKLLNEYKAAYNHFRASGSFTPEELSYLSKVYGNLFNRSLENLDELAMILTASELRMSDDERLSAIDRLYDDMTEKLSFLRAFNKKTSVLDVQRQQRIKENTQMKKIYGVN